MTSATASKRPSHPGSSPANRPFRLVLSFATDLFTAVVAVYLLLLYTSLNPRSPLYEPCGMLFLMHLIAAPPLLLAGLFNLGICRSLGRPLFLGAFPFAAASLALPVLANPGLSSSIQTTGLLLGIPILGYGAFCLVGKLATRRQRTHEPPHPVFYQGEQNRPR